MPDYNGAITLYVHDSDCCTYLGVCIVDDGPYVGKYDLYTCLQGGYRPPTILARYGDPGPCYYSGLCFAAEDRNSVLWEGAKRAIALGILTQEELDKELNYSRTTPARFESAGIIENGNVVEIVIFDDEGEDDKDIDDDGFVFWMKKTDPNLVEDYDYCPDCEEEMIWDAGERIYYCPNTWEHG